MIWHITHERVWGVVWLQLGTPLVFNYQIRFLARIDPEDHAVSDVPKLPGTPCRARPHKTQAFQPNGQSESRYALYMMEVAFEWRQQDNHLSRIVACNRR